MDPITGAVVALIFWFALRTLIAAVIVFGGFGLGALVAAVTDKEGFAVLGLVLGWLGAIAWEIFAIIQLVLSLIDLFRLLGWVQ